MHRLALTLLPLLVSFAAGQAPANNGKPDPAFDELDVEVRAYMKLAGCQAAAVAVGRDGKLLHSKGFGWRDRDKREKTPANALFRVGSVTKPVTAAAVKELIKDGKIRRDTRVFELLKLDLAAAADARLCRVTVGHLLEHKGGWDAHRMTDPVFQDHLVRRDLKLRRACTPDDVVQWMLPRPLDFAPGEREAYSNFGYCLLGRVVEKATDKTFEEALAVLVLKPWKIEDVRVGRTLPKYRHEREVWYPVPDTLFTLEVLDSCAGLTASAPALCELMHRYWLSGDRREAGLRGEFVFVGSLQGTTAVAMQRADGVNLVVLFNNRRDRDGEGDQKALVKRLKAVARAAE